MADEVWFWHRIVSPHMAGLADALAATGREVTFVAEQEMSSARAAQGWQTPGRGKAHRRVAPSIEAVRALVAAAPPDSIHICQAFRGNGLIHAARHALAERGLRQWAIMETVDDAGWKGILKRLEYGRLLKAWRPKLEGVLAIGHRTPAWLTQRGAANEKIFPFTYFLQPPELRDVRTIPLGRAFRLVFVGQFIERKRVDLLLDALSTLTDVNFELAVIGSGPLEAGLRAKADAILPGRVRWLGRQPITEVPGLLAEADCLVLPSRHDGWGAVVSEALMVGTPAICSDACGSAGVVAASGEGGIFHAGGRQALIDVLRQVISSGSLPLDRRHRLADWACCLSADAGARYLSAILAHVSAPRTQLRPDPPWAELERRG